MAGYRQRDQRLMCALAERESEVASRLRIERRSKWRRHFFHRRESIKTTWKLRLAIVLLALLVISVTRNFWSMRIGQSLTCTEKIGRSDIMLVDNVDPDYLLFERAATLHKAGLASRVLIPVQVSHESERANSVSIGIAELMARVAQVQAPEIMPIRASEPISLNAAYQISDFLTREHLRAVIVITPGFRSKRSSLIYQAVLARAGITVYCVPVFVGAALEDWTHSWHGMQEVSNQFFKLQFYRFYFLRTLRL